MDNASNWEFAASIAAVCIGLGGLLLFTLIGTIGSWTVFTRASRAANEAEKASILVQDLSLVEYPALRALAESGLQSSDPLTQATALTKLVGDDAFFERMLTNSSVDPAKVAAEIAAYRRLPSQS